MLLSWLLLILKLRKHSQPISLPLQLTNRKEQTKSYLSHPWTLQNLPKRCCCQNSIIHEIKKNKMLAISPWQVFNACLLVWYQEKLPRYHAITEFIVLLNDMLKNDKYRRVCSWGTGNNSYLKKCYPRRPITDTIFPQYFDLFSVTIPFESTQCKANILRKTYVSMTGIGFIVQSPGKNAAYFLKAKVSWKIMG